MKTVLGIAVIAFGVFLEVMWLGVCFGTVIIGIILLIFAPRILFFPFNFFLLIGLSIMNPQVYRSAREFKYKNNSSRNTNQGYSYENRTDTLDKYYEVLQSNKTDSLDVIKANYRRLIKEYHYDSIASKDLPEAMLKFAEEKTQSINEAYAAIKEAKK